MTATTTSEEQLTHPIWCQDKAHQVDETRGDWQDFTHRGPVTTYGVQCGEVYVSLSLIRHDEAGKDGQVKSDPKVMLMLRDDALVCECGRPSTVETYMCADEAGLFVRFLTEQLAVVERSFDC